jgi:signal transduction histidine kinase
VIGSAPELRPAVTSAAIVAVAGASSGVLPAGAHWAVAAGAAVAAAALTALHTRRVARVADDVATLTRRVAAGEYGGRVEATSPVELRSLADSVNGLAARLAREGHSRANFIGKVSHELRTPLTVIKGYVYALRRFEDDPGRAAKLDIINGECERLAYLVEDLLELSRAQAGELRVSADLFVLRDCVEEMTHRLRPLAEQQDVDLALEWHAGDALVMGDENRVRQIVVNLVTNGIKYAPPRTRVTVRGRHAGDRLEVDVADDGRGIAPADLDVIFDEFSQAPGSEPGAGLGLAIARELATAHGGGIEVESAPGAGTTFTMWLPAWTEDAP